MKLTAEYSLNITYLIWSAKKNNCWILAIFSTDWRRGEMSYLCTHKSMTLLAMQWQLLGDSTVLMMIIENWKIYSQNYYLHSGIIC